MKKTKIVIVEDEQVIAMDIKRVLESLEYEVCGICANGKDALIVVELSKPDLVLMDIRLKGDLSGIETARIIKERLPVPIVFTTGFADETMMNRLKGADPHGCVSKPFKNRDLYTAIEIAVFKHKKEMELLKERNRLMEIVVDGKAEQMIFVRKGTQQVKVNFKDIIYVEALRDYVVIYGKEARYTFHSTMKNMEERLCNHGFSRVHRSFIVRIEKIAHIKDHIVFLENKDVEIPIGASYYPQVMEQLTGTMNLVSPNSK